MKLRKYFLSLFIIMALGLTHAHQQYLVIQANYNIRRQENEILQLLDQNKKLMYNVTTLESPANLEMRLRATGNDYEIPMRWAEVKRLKSETAYNIAEVREGRSVVIKNIRNFLTAKAESRAIKY